jgi:hypothetical protein
LQPITCGKYTVEGVKKSVVRGWELDSTPYIYIYIYTLSVPKYKQKWVKEIW